MLQNRGNETRVVAKHQNLVAENTDYIAWIARCLKKPGKNRSGLARALGVHPSQITKLMDGKRAIRTSEIATISQYCEERPPTNIALAFASEASDTQSVPVVAEAAAEVWLRAERYDAIPIRKDYPHIPLVSAGEEFDGLPQFAIKVVGPSANAVLPSGCFAICVPYWEARSAPRRNDLVIIERHRPESGLLEVSARRLRRAPAGGEWMLMMESADLNFQEKISLGADFNREKEPVMVDGMKVRLVGLVIWKTQPIFHHYDE